ncbi:hypothetical protein TWF694_011684 [Orbilia ellipsospora]|uniref:Uncharacterized protein n=1 Tax=Orbilia ellipsospora TaxID=2528407 RepID=A0AAV9X720_9PEZI
MCYSILTYHCGHFIRGYPHKSCKCGARCVGEQRQPEMCKQWFCDKKPYFSDGCSEKTHITNIRFGAYIHPEHGPAGYRPNQRMARFQRARPRHRATLPSTRIIPELGVRDILEDEVRNLADRYRQLAFTASPASESGVVVDLTAAIPRAFNRTSDRAPLPNLRIGRRGVRRAQDIFPVPGLAQLERLVEIFTSTPHISVPLLDDTATNTVRRRTTMHASPLQMEYVPGASMARVAREDRHQQGAGEAQQVTSDGIIDGDFDDMIMNIDIV